MASRAVAAAIGREGGNPAIVKLSSLQNVPGARPVKKRKGRGPGSGLGKTSTRGYNGRLSRRGLFGKVWFEGGQTPFIRRLPKHGFNRNALKKPFKEVNLGKLADFVRNGRLDSSRPITLKDLYDSGIVGRFRHGIKVLANGAEKLDRSLNLEVSGVSKAAREAVERAGGKVTEVYFNRLGLRAYLKPERFDLLPKRARVPPRLQHKGLYVPSIEEQLERARSLGKILNPPYTYREIKPPRK